MTYSKYFPDFVLDVTLPDGFADHSWHQDAMPHWIDDKAMLDLWIDYADPALREIQDGLGRFNLRKLTDLDTYESDNIISTDDWSEVLAAIEKARKPANDETDPETYFGAQGLEHWSTGGGCYAFGRRLDDDKHHVLVTSDDGCEPPVHGRPVIVGLYNDDGEQVECATAATFAEAMTAINGIIERHVKA